MRCPSPVWAGLPVELWWRCGRSLQTSSDMVRVCNIMTFFFMRLLIPEFMKHMQTGA